MFIKHPNGEIWQNTGYINLFFTGKDDDGNKSLGVVNMETGFQVLKLDGTTQGENAARKGVQN